MAQRTHYWSCSDFADWLRGTPKPGAQTGEGWNKWHKTAKRAHPVRYWIAEEGLDMVQNFLCWPKDKLYDIKYYINNRWVTRTHSLTAAPNLIPRGEWRDLGNRFLPCLFSELVDFVEVELAWSNVAWDSAGRKKYNPPFYAWGWFRWRTWRCPEAGLDYLNWAKSLDNSEFLGEDEKHLAEPTPQAVSAAEILELYNWWKNVYPNRLDPHDLSGWTQYCEDRRQKRKQTDPDTVDLLWYTSNESEEEKNETRRLLDLTSKIEADQFQEDTDMLIRLIKVRNHLWT